jgi:outer membrane lipase/esterase
VPVNLGGARVVDPNGLYTIFGGANNVFDAAANPDPVARAAAVTGALDDIQTIALALRARGASRFLIPFMPNVGLTPQARFIDTFVAPGYVANATAMAQSFNLQLAGRLAALDLLPGVSQVLGLRLDLLLENIRADAMTGGGRYGITNVTLPCIAEPPRFPIAAPSCASALFSDPRHVSGRTHELIADAATRLVLTGQNVTAIPEPGTVALVATGLGVLALGARRRRRAA